MKTARCCHSERSEAELKNLYRSTGDPSTALRVTEARFLEGMRRAEYKAMRHQATAQIG